MSNIVSVIIQSGVSLSKAGDKYVGNCPFHEDKDPSLVVYPATESWCCFGSCQSKNGGRLGGDAIEFVRLKYGYSFKEAKEFLGDLNIKAPVELPSLKRKKSAVISSDSIMYWCAMLDHYDKRGYFYSRGFVDETIDREAWGWTGEHYSIPVWADEPQASECLGIRFRRAPGGEGPKYKSSIDGRSCLWGRWHIRNVQKCLIFAGEFDAALSVQHKLPAISVVGGMQSFNSFPDNWADLWMPSVEKVLVVFDSSPSSEYMQAAKLAEDFNRQRGLLRAKVFNWPPSFDGDFTDWVLAGNDLDVFIRSVK